MVVSRSPMLAAIVVLVWLSAASTVAAQGGPARDLSSAAKSAAELDQLHSLLVSWRGELVLEHYAPQITAGRLANIKSASKSIISTLVGIAIARGLLKGVDEPIATYLPQLARAPAAKRRIALEDLLTMRSGLESTSGPNYGPWVRSRNWVQYALDRPLVSEPGTTMEYSTGTSHILSAILTRVSKRSTWQFAQETLARPLGISLARWTRDPQGIYFGGNEMLMTPRQMVALGELYLNRGQAKGRQVVPADWVDESCRPRTRSVWDPTREYGYGWWIQDIGGYRACFAWGYGGQYIFTFRDLDLVVVVTSSITASEERHGYRRRLFGVVAEHVLRPMAAAQTGRRPSLDHPIARSPDDITRSLDRAIADDIARSPDRAITDDIARSLDHAIADERTCALTPREPGAISDRPARRTSWRRSGWWARCPGVPHRSGSAGRRV